MFERDINRIAQRISFGVDVSDESPLLVAAAQVLLKEYIPSAPRPTKVYVAPHYPGKPIV
jgi:hypothetical protein